MTARWAYPCEFHRRPGAKAYLAVALREPGTLLMGPVSGVALGAAALYAGPAQ